MFVGIRYNQIALLQVALLMLLAQKIVFLLLSRGERYIGPLTDYTARLIEESSADFVVSSGGWVNNYFPYHQVH